MNRFVKFFHELFNPHCEHCNMQTEIRLEIERESRRCESCESLRMQIAILNDQNKTLIEKIVNPNPVVAQPVNEVQPKPIHRGHVPFSVVRRQLEADSIRRAEQLRAEAAMKNAAQPDTNNETVEKEPAASELNLDMNAAIDKSNDVSELEEMVFNAGLKRTAETGTKQ